MASSETGSFSLVRSSTLRSRFYFTPPNSNVERPTKKSFASSRQAHKFAAFQGARPEHLTVESSCCCFPRELVSFVRPRELASFNPKHVARFPPIGKRTMYLSWEVKQSC